ncbi:hypothetical protein QAD02_023521 [Eretmocerus hayati]|uniref:Uncharacterized protein n=1 Tax=Eretmocerus hayati TaxID=131215 RepID=A0ACC2PW92_9HYME|nr:hypothetical protein QAD02_023521 [Eretmocerus hayati]
MSNTHIAREWLQARKDLQKIVEADKALLDGKRIEERADAINKYLDFYYRYRKMVQRLTSCHDQMVQPQIRPLVGKMLDNCILRMLEYRRELVDITFTECGWSVEPMLRLKMTPDDTELSAPIYNASARRAEFERRRQLAEEAQIANANQPPTEWDQDGEASEITSLSSLSTMQQTAPASDDNNEVQQSKASLRAGSRGRPAAGAKQDGIEAPSVSLFSMIKETPEERAEREAREAEREKLNDVILMIQAHERARIGRGIGVALEFRKEFERKMMAGEIDEREPKLEVQTKAAIIIQRAWRRFKIRRLEKHRQNERQVMKGYAYPCWTSNKLLEQAEKNFVERQDMQAAAVQKLKDAIERAKKKIWETRTPKLREDIRDEIREWWFYWLNEIGRMDALPIPEHGGSSRLATGEIRTPDEYLAALAAASEKKKPAENKADEDADNEDDEDEEPSGFGLQPSLAIPGLDDANEEFERDWGLHSDEILHPDAPLVMHLETDELNCQLQLEVRPTADEDMRELQGPLNRALVLDHAKDDNPFVLPQPQQFIDPEEDDKSKKKPPKEKPDPLAEVPESELLFEMSKWKVMRDDVPKKRLRDWPGAETCAEKLPHLSCVGDVKHPVIDYCVLPLGSKIIHELAPLVRSVAICGPANSGQLDLVHAVCTELQVLFLMASQESFLTSRPFNSLHDKLILIPPVDHGTAYFVMKRTLMKHCAINRDWDASTLARMFSRKTCWGVLRDAAELPALRRAQLASKPFYPMELLERVNHMNNPNIKKWTKWFEKTSLMKKRRQLEKEELMPQPEDPKKKKK